MNLFNSILVFCVGACIGSFLNVCIYRVPLRKSVIRPRSHCAACGLTIPWYHNIPILSWFILRGRSACCGSKIEFRYPVVELLTAVLVFLIWKHYPPPLAAINTVYVCGLIVAAMIDIDHCIIPDEISVGGILFGITTSFFCPRLFETTNHLWAVKESFIGFIVGGGLLFCIAIGGSVLFQKEAMGMGDVKLLAAIGSFVGWKGVFWIVPVSSFLGSIIGALLLLRKRRFLGVRMPFGPFLAAAGILWLLGGREWMDEYLRLF